MLVLTRRIGEKIVIGDAIQVEVVSIQGNHVRLGVTAPTSVLVDREEICQRRANLTETPLDPQQVRQKLSL